MDTLSIIIPHKDIPHLLRRCLDSIPQRDGIHIIVVDDNSSADIVDFDDFPGKNRPDVKLVFDRKGGGAGYARNIGLGFADSRWVMFADADDYFIPGALDIVSGYFDSEFDAVLFKNVSVDSETGVASDRGDFINKTIERGIRGELTARESFALVSPSWAKLVSLDFLRSNNISFDEIPLANDVMFSARIACCGNKLGLSGYVIYTIVSRKGSLTYNLFGHDDFITRWDILCHCNRYLLDNGIRMPCMAPKLRTAWNIGFRTFWECVWILTKNGLALTGMGRFLFKKFFHK